MTPPWQTTAIRSPALRAIADLDGVDRSLLEVVARLGVRVDVPVALVEHPFADSVQ